MNDILLQKFFEMKRWEEALETGVDKHIDKGELRKLCTPEVRIALYNAIVTDNYEIAPPHQVQIPKDNGDMRIVYVNENVDRIFLSIANNLFFELFPEFIHPACKSYTRGIGCGRIVQEVSRQVINTNGSEVGLKADLTKYFDRVPIRYIDEIFDRMEAKVGKSKIIDVVKKYYHTDLCFDIYKFYFVTYFPSLTSILKPGDAVHLVQTEIMQHFTQPPPRYSEASLVCHHLSFIGIVHNFVHLRFQCK